MALFKADGSRVTKAAFPSTTLNPADVPKVLTEDLWATRRFDSVNDKVPHGSIKTRFAKAGTIMTQGQIDALFPAATVDSVSPATGTTAGGVVVTVKGTNLDGVTSVTFGGTAGTNLKVVSPTEVKVTTPAKTAGAVVVAVVDDSGPASKANGYTYA